MVTDNYTMLEDHNLYLNDPPGLLSKKRITKVEDPMSHRIIEKRRRDRMNNCLADLSRLIPTDYMKKGRGRIEKTEIIEMAIKHMRYLQNALAAARSSGDKTPADHVTEKKHETSKPPSREPIVLEHYRLGYLECLSEAMHFLVEVQGFFAGDSLCVQMMNHLHKHCDKILKGDTLNFPRKLNSGETTSNSSSSTANGAYHTNNNSPPLGTSNSTGSNSDEHTQNNRYEQSSSEMYYKQESYKQTNNHSQDSKFTAPKPSPAHQHSNSVQRYVDEEAQYLRKDTLCRHPSNSSGFFSSTSADKIHIHKEENIHNESQLREMLASPFCLSQMGTKESDTKTMSPSLSQTSGCETSSTFYHSPQDSDSYDHHSMYKFKNTIKQRFTKESLDEKPVKKQKINDSSRFNTKNLNSLHSPESFENSNGLTFGIKKNEIKLPEPKGLAVFALHADKSFYVPLTIDANTVPQFFSVLGLTETYNDNKPVLHPVTISVNFQPQLHVKEEQQQEWSTTLSTGTSSPD